jgi:hypothetical protein
VRRALIATGLLAMGYAVAGALTDPDVQPIGVVIFLVAVLVAHDGILLPAMIGLGALIGRLPDPAPVRIAAVTSAAVALVGVPFLIGSAGVPASRLLLVLGLVWAGALVVTLVRRNRKGSESSSPAPDR